MSRVIRGAEDEAVRRFKAALGAYEAAHPGAEACLYRQNPGSIRIRVVDRRFEEMPRSRRHDELWAFLTDRVGADEMEQVSLLLALGPGETGESLANLDFEQPLKSEL